MEIKRCRNHHDHGRVSHLHESYLSKFVIYDEINYCSISVKLALNEIGGIYVGI